MIQDTSAEAFEAADHEGQRARVLALFAKRDGWTADEAAAHYRAFHNTIAPAFTFLKNDGVLYDSGERRLTRCKRRAIVWKLTDAAKARLV